VRIDLLLSSQTSPDLGWSTALTYVPAHTIKAAFTEPMLLLPARELPEGANWAKMLLRGQRLGSEVSVSNLKVLGMPSEDLLAEGILGSKQVWPKPGRVLHF
jgi:hypothetical protein